MFDFDSEFNKIFNDNDKNKTSDHGSMEIPKIQDLPPLNNKEMQNAKYSSPISKR